MTTKNETIDVSDLFSDTSLTYPQFRAKLVARLRDAAWLAGDQSSIAWILVSDLDGCPGWSDDGYDFSYYWERVVGGALGDGVFIRAGLPSHGDQVNAVREKLFSGTERRHSSDVDQDPQRGPDDDELVSSVFDLIERREAENRVARALIVALREQNR